MTIQLRYLSGALVFTAEVDSARFESTIDGEANAELELHAEEWMPIKGRLDPRIDAFEVYVDGGLEHSGRYADSQEVRDRVMVQLGSWEEDARTAEPTEPGLAYAQNDGLVARDLIRRMPGLHAGTVESVQGTVELELPRRSPAGALRSLARATGALVHYTAHRTVDYAAELGANRNGPMDQVLRMADEHTEGNVEGLEAKRDARLDPTHVLVLGAGEGSTQVAASAVDPSFQGGREVWQRLEDSKIQTIAEARLVAETHIEELLAAPVFLEVRCTGVTVWPRPALGDRFHVQDVEQGVDDVLRVLERVWTVGPTGDDVEILLGNRRSRA